MHTSPLLKFGIHGARVLEQASEGCELDIGKLNKHVELALGVERRCKVVGAPPLSNPQFIEPPAHPLIGTAQPEKGTRPAGKAPCPADKLPCPTADGTRPAAETPCPAAKTLCPAVEMPSPTAKFPRPAADGTRPAAEFPRPAEGVTGQKGPSQGGNASGRPQDIEFLKETPATQPERQEVALHP